MTSFMTMDFDKCPFMPTSRDACTSWTNAFAEDVQASLDAGMNGHIAKPIVIEEVVKTIARNLDR